MTQESVTFWRESALSDMEVLKATYITHSFSRHSHEGYAIGTIEAGVEAFEYMGSAYRAPAGSLVIIHPGEVHTGHAAIQAGWRYRMIYPSVDLLQKAAVELGKPTSLVPFFPEAVISDRSLVQQFRQFHQALEQGTTLLERESRMLWLMSHLVARYGELRSPLPRIKTDHSAVKQVHAYLHEHYHESITLEDLSRTVNLPPLKLLRLCQKAWGLPPHRYLIQLRVQQAKRLIAKGISLVEVAASTGFADQSHLNRHFKRFVGVTPGQYRKGC